MAVFVIATWVAKEGQEDTVERLLSMNALATKEEPGCREFTVLRQRDMPRMFVLYEVYDDEGAFEAHRESEHFKKYVLEDAVANERLESRTFAQYDVVA